MSSLLMIENALSDLMENRAEVEAEIAFTPAQVESRRASLEEFDKAIVEYVTKEIRKVDNIARWLIEMKLRREAIAAERARLGGIQSQIERQETRIKDLVLQVMRDFGDVKKLTGSIGSLRRQNNGGIAPLEIPQPDLVPNSLKRITITLPFEVWQFILDGDYDVAAPCAIVSAVHAANDKAYAEPDPKAIREALESDVGVPGARLADRGEHLRVG
jgi:hypothetical protein